MPEMRHINCPSCQTDNVPLAVVEGIEEYRCRACGLVFYGPCGCDIGHSKPAKQADDHLGDWQMSRVATPAHGASAVRKYPGCS
jgi:transcription initiation factor TFIIIB Brf1 subunit/transcription initiation factor TFIIB